MAGGGTKPVLLAPRVASRQSLTSFKHSTRLFSPPIRKASVPNTLGGVGQACGPPTHPQGASGKAGFIVPCVSPPAVNRCDASSAGLFAAWVGLGDMHLPATHRV
jgi:hypothetical protein